MPLRRKMYLWLTRLAVGASVTLTVTMLTIWIYSRYHSAWIWRTSWNLTATQDEWQGRSLYLGQGFIDVSSEHEIKPAFIASFTGEIPYPSNRTVPSGTTWGWVQDPTSTVREIPTGLFWRQRFGISWSTRGVAGKPRWSVEIELWLLTLICLVATTLTILLSRRASLPFRRLRAGLCPTCGYDIRVTPEKCPECGGTIPS
jgi:hypothetical protein